jgi:hypothetical protein
MDLDTNRIIYTVSGAMGIDREIKYTFQLQDCMHEIQFEYRLDI